jgi:hypothetical protein
MTIRQSLVECAHELSSLQSHDTLTYTEAVAVEQRHGRADGKLVELHDRNGAPVLEEKDGIKSFVGSLGGVCMSCPVLEAGDGCAIRDNFQELTDAKRSEREKLDRSLAIVSNPDLSHKRRKAKTVRVPGEVIVTSLPEDQRAAAEDPEAREARLKEIAERADAREDAVAAIYKGRRQGYGYPGAATRRPNTGSKVNEDHSDHISEGN